MDKFLMDKEGHLLRNPNYELKKEKPLVVYCEWCDKSIFRYEDRIIKDNRHFCSPYCWWNYDDCNNED